MAGVLLTGAVRGLVSEGERVAGIISEREPAIVGLSISKEGLMAMDAHIRGGEVDAGLDNLEEEIYVAGLEVFGDVVKPPPCYAEAYKTASKAGISVEPLDMDDEEYTDAYCRNISTLEVLSQGRCQRRIARHQFQAKTAEEFVMEFDSIVNGSKGFRRLEAEREEKISGGIRRLANGNSTLVAIVEVERLEGVKRNLTEAGMAFELV